MIAAHRANLDCSSAESFPLPSRRVLGTVRIMVGTKPLPASAIYPHPIHHGFSPCTISAQIAASVRTITSATRRFIG